jgi:uncharacterized membrane protein YdjX (TVP38/TMEM64 family)
MEQLINNLIQFLKDISLSYPPVVSFIFGFSLIVLESIIPILPLALFIAFNVILFGNVIGFILSWVATICGCLLSYFICRKGFSSKIYRHIDQHGKIEKFVKAIKYIPFSNLVVVMAIPFTPAFSINVGAGLSRMPLKKFLFALIIAKLFIVYFWGFVGTTFVESITDITVLFKLGVIILISYILSKIVLKKFHIE